MPLGAIQTDFEAGLVDSVRVYEELATTRTFASASDFAHEDLCVLEGLLSHLWQCWCRFSRSLLIESCTGTVDLSGNGFPQVPGASSASAVSGAAIRIRRRQAAIWGAPNAVLRLEPTWGDVDALIDIIGGIGPANAAKLTGMCTMAGPSVKIIQAIRNAAAHLNPQSVTEVLRISGPYFTFPITHPCQALFWVERSTGNYLLPDAIEGLSMASMYAVI
jgi:hypothetical protein